MDRGSGPYRVLPWILLGIAVYARLHLQMAAMPPYAGLDEIYHVARLAFTAQEGRSPGMTEPSMPPYLAASIAGDPGSLPAFGIIAERWPSVVASRGQTLPDRRLQQSDLRPYRGANYEAQQPALYYIVAAKLLRLLPQRSPIGELRLWRGFSAFCGLIVVLATATIGWRVAGDIGVIAAALVASLPTWLTLVVRASNDALACALIAAALAVTIYAPARFRGYFAEAVLWAGALATKLYAWPIAVVLPFLWRAQRARSARVLVVMAAGAASVLATLLDLGARTNNPLGLFAFDAPARSAATAVPIAYGEMLRIWIASFAWTGPQHWNALRPIAIALYLGPVLLLIAIILVSRWRESRMLLAACAIALLAFALAQAVNAAGYIRIARAEGVPLPAGGKEGWYWYTLVPLGAGVVLAIVVRHLRPVLLIALVVWLAGWDVVIHEGALFQDFAGYTSSAEGDWLLRWGPRTLPFARDLQLERISVGPGASLLNLFRIIHLSALTAMIISLLRLRGQSE